MRNFKYDTHTLYAHSKELDKQQIIEAISKSLYDYKQKYNKNIQCMYNVNVLLDKDKNKIGVAFIFLTNPEVYHMLLGRNPDGTEMEKIKNTKTDNNKQSESRTRSNVDLDDASNSSITAISWADLCDSSDESEEVSNDESEEIEIYPEPLMKLGLVKLTTEQKNKMCDSQSNFEIKIEPAGIRKLGDDLIHNELMSLKIPDWVSASRLKKEIKYYASDYTTIHTKRINGKNIDFTYPMIHVICNKNKTKTARVTFDPLTNDAQFALHMIKKLQLVKDQNQCCELIFKHPRKLKSKNFGKFGYKHRN